MVAPAPARCLPPGRSSGGRPWALTRAVRTSPRAAGTCSTRRRGARPSPAARTGLGRDHVRRLRDRAGIRVPRRLDPPSRCRRRPARGHRLRALVRDVPGDRLRAGVAPTRELDRVADAGDGRLLRRDGDRQRGRQLPDPFRPSGRRARVRRVRSTELGPDRRAARHVPAAAVPGRASAVAALAMVRVGASGSR